MPCATGCSTPHGTTAAPAPRTSRCWPREASAASSPTSRATSRPSSPPRVLPVVTLVAIAWLDPLSGLVVALTLPLVPVFAVLVGMTTRDRAERAVARARGAVRALPRRGARAADARRPPPRRRAGRQHPRRSPTATAARRWTRCAWPSPPRRSSSWSRRSRSRWSRSPSACGWPRESVDFRVALTVLLLAPEAYWPLRRVGAEFHAAAEGAAALARADALLAAATDDARHRLRPTSTTRWRCAASRSATHATPPWSRPSTSTCPARGLVAVAGPSGCGKSTLLATLRGELPAGGRRGAGRRRPR